MDTGTDSGLDENIRREDSPYNRSYVALYTVWASILENGHVRSKNDLAVQPHSTWTIYLRHHKLTRHALWCLLD